MGNRQQKRVLTLLAFGMGLAAWIPMANAIDLSVQEDTLKLTPASQIAQSQFRQAKPNRDGELDVTTIKAMRVAGLEKNNNDILGEADSVSIQPVSYSKPVAKKPQATPAIMVLPVMVRGNSKEKAFMDLPVLVSTAVANQLTAKIRAQGLNYKVLNPLYTYDELKEKGLDGLYQKLADDFSQAGQPNEQDLQFLADKLATPTQPVVTVVFVQAEFDMNKPEYPNTWQKPMAYLYDRGPKTPNYQVKSTAYAYSLEPGTPLLWHSAAQNNVKLTDFGNFTRSVFDDNDSAMTFKATSVQMAQKLVSAMPKETMQTRSTVQATLADTPANISTQDQEALKRILQY